MRRIAKRDRAVADIVRGRSRYQINEIVAVEDGDGTETGAFVVKVASDPVALWFAVDNGERLPQGWRTRPMAILHLLSVRYGDGGDRGIPAQYAARVLGIKDGD